MMKSTIATILGTAVLGLLKKHVGSSTRLKIVHDVQVSGESDVQIPIKPLPYDEWCELSVIEDQDFEGCFIYSLKYIEITSPPLLIIRLSTPLLRVDGNTHIGDVEEKLISEIHQRIDKIEKLYGLQIDDSQPIDFSNRWSNRIETAAFRASPILPNNRNAYIRTDIDLDKMRISLFRPRVKLLVNADTNEPYKAPKSSADKRPKLRRR